MAGHPWWQSASRSARSPQSGVSGLKRARILGYCFGMKFSPRRALLVVLLVPLACNKSQAPAPAGSAAALSSNAVLPGQAPGAASSLAILDGFEGEIALTAKGKLGGKEATALPTNVSLQVKDGKFRVDLPEGLAGARGIGPAYALVLPTDKKLYFVMDAKKQAVLVDFDKFANQAKLLSQAHARPDGAATTPASVQKTGKVDTVAGYKCEIWHIVQAKTVGDLCIAEQGTSWFQIPLSGAPAEFAWASEIADGKHFPLRYVMSEGGVEVGRIEVTSIQKKPLPATAFELPAGYAVMDLQQMLGAMMGGMGAMMPPGALPSGFAPGMLPPGVHPGAHGKKEKP
jgi:hypothetical protein